MKKAIVILMLFLMTLTACGNKNDDFIMEKSGSIPLGEGYIDTYSINRLDRETASKKEKGSYFLLEDLISCGYTPKMTIDGDTGTIELEYRKIPSKNVSAPKNMPENTRITMDGKEIKSFEYNGRIFVLADTIIETAQAGAAKKSALNQNARNSDNTANSDKTVIFLDPGHGVSSSSMTSEEKEAAGWSQNNGEWGEWRHWTNGEYGSDCCGNDGVAQPKECWYPIGNGDRNAEPDINLANCQAAKRYLEQTGKYTVILSRDENNLASLENPSITERIKNAQAQNAAVYVCIHSNAGGGKGSAYIALDETSGYYKMNRGDTYASDGNRLGKMINDKIVSKTGLSEYSNGRIDGEEYMILFQKAPMPCAYLEIGFYDNSSDLEILQNNSDAIGKAIAEGIEEYFGE